jgi:protein-tyrosine phosphatase
MTPAVINLEYSDDPRDAVHRAVAALSQGKIVAVPTETVYGLAASALNEEAVARLFEIKGRAKTKGFALAVKSAEDALDYVPRMSPLARRLARRCWPGPVTLVLPDAHQDSVIIRLPPTVQQAILQDGAIGLRVPASDITLQILRFLVGPLVLTSANRSGEPEANDVEKFDPAIRQNIDMIIDAGPCRFGQSSSVVRVDDHSVTVLREGVVNIETLRQLSQYLVLFVCTGNTCRSPMAERIFEELLAAKLGCQPEQLTDHGIQVESAGMAAFPGGKPSREAVEILARHDIDLSTHCSQPLTERLVRHADLILAMTQGHLQSLVNQWPDAAPRTFLLRSDRQDIGDPIGQPVAAYQRCAEEISTALKPWVTKIAAEVEHTISVGSR